MRTARRPASPLPVWTSRPLATLVLLGAAGGLAWFAAAAGWPREQVLLVGILSATVLLWVTDALPLFATAFISIAAQLLLLGNPGEWTWLGFERQRGPTPDAFLSAAADPVLLLFFAGLVLARAATKTGLDQRLASVILRPLGADPSHLLLGVIAATAAFSMWMSNTATTALMLALLAPVLIQIPPAEPFRKALLLAVPLAGNIAGMSTPIASPPNAIAISYLAQQDAAIAFWQWMAVACPIVAILLLFTWRRLLSLYPPPPASGWRIVFAEVPLSGRGLWVLVVALATFGIWLAEPWHGVRASAAAVVPVTLLFATNVITRADVNTLDWDVLILIAGGLTLGYSLQATALDARLATLIPADAADAIKIAALGAATLALGTFFSNTAVASMLMPVGVVAAGVAGEQSLFATYALTIALTASLSMALPVSTPPNAMAYARGELTSGDFVRTGGAIGLLGVLLVIAVLLLVRI